MKLKASKPGILAIFFWVLSFILSFKIPPSSHYIWVPDTLLLLGFVPLLIDSRARWLWLVFGVCNMVAGFTLTLSTCMPDAAFAAGHMVAIKKHLQLYHPFMVWLLIGFISIVIGVVLLLTAGIYSLVRKIKSAGN